MRSVKKVGSFWHRQQLLCDHVLVLLHGLMPLLIAVCLSVHRMSEVTCSREDYTFCGQLDEKPNGMWPAAL